ncbi:DMT family transporter [Azospirillum sp. SYSU D00513]|uniref:DMT family transporter n=1 Tax=Azospirillum sp. SYSU D00513 TaxID=2812561 RepID=UPI001FFFBEF5|nr:DMT family transporter [Azospirillum sp. SYSU D00513]
MPYEALIAVLLGAVLHASWNAAIKSGRNKLFDTVLVSGGSALISAAAIPFLPIPAADSLPYLACSAALQVFYCLLLAAAYRTGDMSHAYPLMRGTAPLIVAVASGGLLGETLSAAGWAGTLLICGGVLTLALARRGGGAPAASTGFALVNAVLIAGYTVIDGKGVRLSGAPVAYVLWLNLCSGLALAAWALWRHPRSLSRHAASRWRVGLGGGFCTLASYGLALWAMTLAPIATVAALRETSILFGMALAALVIKERVGPARLASGVVIALGAATLRLAG